ncbi:hypothetical protein EV127DRAFT_488285 [Xylaria flabelliformis]|nr:hypothetical protein EV127DRAFT_488285 [Xylaria flabelliformis]
MAESSPRFPTTIAIINDYVTGDVDAPTTAARLAKPIEQAYSTADHGVARYNEEMAARNQRTHWSPEEAFEKWGPEQDVPKPSPEIASLPSTEGQLWELWYAALHAAKRIPWTDEARQNKLLDLVKAFKARPDPPLPSPMTTPLKRNWIWESGTLWSSLSLLGPSIRESWNDACGHGSGWTNINAFVARLTASETADFDNYAIWALSGALEDEIQDNSLYHDISRPTQLGLSLTVASVWIQIAGKHLYKRHLNKEESGQVDFEVDLATRRTFPWTQSPDKPSFCIARWNFWRGRFAQEARNEELSEGVRELAAKSADIIDGFTR